MMFYIILPIVIILALIYVFYDLAYIKSETDGNYYWVRNNKDKQQSSNVLGDLNLRIVKLVDYFKKTKGDIRYKGYEKYIDRLISKYKYSMLCQAREQPNFTSYTSFKSTICMCLHQKDTGKLVETNTLTYVLLHELTHAIADKSISEAEHYTDPEFNSLFPFLLKISMTAGTWRYTDYKKTPQKYCGIVIDTV
jgi:hypothetical protein